MNILKINLSILLLASILIYNGCAGVSIPIADNINMYVRDFKQGYIAGVMLTEVVATAQDGTTPANVALQKGDVVMEINRMKVADVHRFMQIANSIRPGTDSIWLVHRGNGTIYVAQNIRGRYIVAEKSGIVTEQSIAHGSANIPMPNDTQAVALNGYGNYHALIIGNNNYTSLPKLQTAISDAKAVADILGNEYGFKVTLLLDAKRSDILLVLGRFREKLPKNDNLLIYYAGHGWLDKDGDEGYWLPVDATKDNEVNWISNASITTQLKAMTAKHVLIVADSCFSGKLGRSVHIQKRTSDYYSRIAQKRARSVIASGGLEPVVDSGGKGNHSVFASAFIEALQDKQSVIDTTELFGRIRQPVVLNSDQTPEYADIRKAGHEGGEFVFIKKK